MQPNQKSYQGLRPASPAVGQLMLWSLLLLAGWATTARAADINWINPAGGSFNEPTNWDTGTVPSDADNAIIILDGTYTVRLDASASAAGLVLGGANGTQTLDLNGFTLTLAAPATINANGNEVSNGGALTAPGYNVSGTLNWSGGDLNGPINIAPGARLNISPSDANKYLEGTLNNSGTITWSSNQNDSINAGDQGGTINNLAGGVFNNVASSTVTNQMNQLVFNNAGTVNGQAGTLEIYTGATAGASSGTFNAAAGDAYRIVFDGGGNYIFNNGTSFAGAGVTRLASNEVVQGATTVSGTVEMTDASLGGTTAFTVAGGGNFNWKGGAINGTLAVATGGRLNISPSNINKSLAGTINNSGLTTWASQTHDGFGNDDPSNPGIFNNLASGVFNNVASSIVSNEISGVDFNNAGTVNGQSGNLTISTVNNGNGTSSGTFNAAAGTGYRISFTSGANYNFKNGARFTGPGVTQLATDTIAQGTITVLGTLEMTDASLGGAGILTVANGGNFNWKGGAIDGTLTVATGGKLNISSSNSNKYLVGTINNSGTTTWASRSNDQIAYFSGNSDATPAFNNRVGGVFNNVGTPTATNTFSSIAFNNAGTVNGQGGILSLGTGSSNDDIGTSSGTFNAAGTGYRINFATGNYTFNTGTRFTGSGTTQFTDVVTIDGAATVLGTVEMSGTGKLDGNQPLTVASGGNFNWKAGEIDGALTVATGGKLNISAGSKTLAGTINNSGIATWSSRTADTITGGFDTETPRLINNKTGGVFNTLPGTTVSTLDNGVDFDNAGTLNIGGGLTGGVAPGIFHVGGDYVQTATGILNIQLSGIASSQFDQLKVDGKATLGGTLNALPIGSFLPNYLSAYKFLTYDSRSGTFAKINGDFAGNRNLRVVYNPQDATLITSIDPTIGSFTPTSAAAGTVVTITGTNLFDVGQVVLNNEQLAFTHPSATSITFKVPATATSGKLVVINPAGMATSVGVLKILPTISSFTPTSGPVGTSVRITGANLTGATSVMFRGTGSAGINATFTRISATIMQVTVPAGATTGPITITIPGGTTSSHTAFTVTPKPQLVAQNALSTATARAATASVQLKWLVALDAEVASDPARYAVEVNGRTVNVESAAYNVKTKSVTLALPEGALHSGVHVVARWDGLATSQGEVLKGQTALAAGP